MKHVAVFLAEGFEEIEALTVVDYLRRAGVHVTTVAVPTQEKQTAAVVVGSHAIPITADALLEDYVRSGALPDSVYVPGGMPGAANIGACESALSLIKHCAAAGKLVAAICAAPVVVLAKTRLLSGRRYTCYPGMESQLAQYCGGSAAACEATAGSTLVSTEPFVLDGNVLTGRGPGAAEQFAMELVRLLTDEATRDTVAHNACQRGY